MDKIRETDAEQQARIAWQTVNQITSRYKTPKEGILKANNVIKRKWKDHFNTLLGKHLTSLMGQ